MNFIDENKTPKCPKCQSEMRKRKGKYGQFWGCSTFPKCKGIRKITFSTQQLKRALKSIDKPNPRQKEIFESVDQILSGKADFQHLQVNAGAGTGKTTTEEHVVGMIRKVNPTAKVVYLVFNKHVEVEATSKGLPAKTTHSFYFSQLRNNSKSKIKIEDKKVVNIIKDLIQETWDDDKYLISPVSQLVSKVKNTCAPDDNTTLEKLADRFNVQLNGSQDRIFELIRLTLNANNRQLNIVDFDDMLYLTWKTKCPIEKQDWVLIDEAQDFNRVQIELIKRTVKDDGHVLVVGDSNQSMYGFRGAALDAMERFGDYFNVKELPLDITYRCPKSHVRLVNQEFPYISFIAHDKAEEGDINTLSTDKFLGSVRDGDLVLCRTNAPLVKYVFSLKWTTRNFLNTF